MKKQKNNQGFAHIILMLALGLGVVLIVASAGAYYFLKMQGSSYTPILTGNSKPYNYASPSVSPISNSDKTIDIQSEFNATSVNSVDTDLNQLDASSKSL